MFIVYFVEYLKDVLEKKIFVSKAEANLYIQTGKKCFSFVFYLQFRQGCNWN